MNIEHLKEGQRIWWFEYHYMSGGWGEPIAIEGLALQSDVVYINDKGVPSSKKLYNSDFGDVFIDRTTAIATLFCQINDPKETE